jgi:two-component system, LytTR family, sensor histidine kinase AlgZ
MTSLTIKRTSPALLMLAAQVITTTIVVLAVFRTSVQPVHFAIGYLFAGSIGWLYWMALSWVRRCSLSMHPVSKGALSAATLAAATVIGISFALLVMAIAGWLPWAQFWRAFRIAIVAGIVIAFINMFVGLAYDSLHYRARYAETQARLVSLQARLQPHFLFNTLNSIASLTGENAAAAERMVEQLASLLRLSLDFTDSTIPLLRELDATRIYLEIEKTRFAERLTYSIDIARDTHAYSVPPFCVQTAVENAVKYGGHAIQVTARKQEDALLLTVSDDGPGFDDEMLVVGHALWNLRERLRLLWGDKATLAIGRDDAVTRVTICIPTATLMKSP